MMYLGSTEMTISTKEEIRYKFKQKDTMKKLVKETHFDYDEVQHLTLIYFKLLKLYTKSTGKREPKHIEGNMFKLMLLNGFNMTDYKYFPFIQTEINRSKSTKFISLENFVKGMSVFLKGSLEEKIKYCFGVYSSMAMTEGINKKHLYTIIGDCLIDDESGSNDVADMLIKKLDIDRNGSICFNDFRESVLRNPLLLQCFGPVLPERQDAYAFKCTFMKNPKM